MRSGRPSSCSWATGTTPTGTGTAASPPTVTTTRPRSRSSRCSPGRSSWRWNGQAGGPGPQASARSHVPVRVGAGNGAGKRGGAGRRGTLGRKDTGAAIVGIRWLPLLFHVCGPFFVAQSEASARPRRWRRGPRQWFDAQCFKMGRIAVKCRTCPRHVVASSVA